ncbi:MAG: LemA family protein [Desulfovibrio sp.]|jgi:LemA protein|nr:LemA family protein [Desulfovibrio sp.]
MSDSLIFLIVVAVLAVILVGWAIAIYNKLVRLKTMKEEGWSGVDVQLKRRRDLVGNLVNAVKGYMTHERGVLEEVVKYRSISQSATGVGAAPAVAGVAAAEGLLSQSLGRLFAVMENYPDLKANTNVLQLQNDLSLLEDEIQKARRYYNGAVRDLNILIRSFPSNIIAGWYKFVVAEFFELENVADREAPVVNL